jgi:hypothetical protein
MNKSIPLLAVVIGCLLAGSVAGPAMARTGGSFGGDGRMSGFTSWGLPSDTQAPSAQSFTPMTSYGARDSDTGLNSSNVFRSLDSPIPRIANSPGP